MSFSITNSSPTAVESVCKHENLIVDDHRQVCESCGLVIEEEEFLTTPFSLFQPSQQPSFSGPLPRISNKRFRFRNRRDYNLYCVGNVLGKILTALTLPVDQLVNQCRELLHHFPEQGPVGMLQICLAYVYHKSRLEGWPLTLTQLSAVSSQPTSKILCNFSVLLERGLIDQTQQPSPAVFFEMILQRIKKSISEANISVGDNQKVNDIKAINLACQLLSLVEGVVEGRKPEPLAHAIIILCLEHLYLMRAVTIQELKDIYCCKSDSYSTVYNRYREIRDVLIKCAAKLPFPVNKADLHLYLDQIIVMCNILNSKAVELPPAFLISELETEQKLERIGRARNRLNVRTSASPSKENGVQDELDLFIEELILEGYDDNQICQLY
jgi:transcription initiation factor TFIIIB Brf1 subunit/transcription initiation factor TFIIB